jgi:hypothetical protein
MEELRLMAERLTEKANIYTALKELATDEETKNDYRERVMACLECVAECYNRIYELNYPKA